MASTPPPQGPNRSERYPKILADLADAVAAFLIRKGIAPAVARSTADETAEHVRATFGGEIIYIPTGHNFRLMHRNAEIRRRLAAGEDRATIRRAFDLSDMQLRRIETDDAPGRR